MSGQSLPVYLVSLPDDQPRRDALRSRFPETYSQFNVIPATDGRRLSASDYYNYQKTRLERGQRLMAPSELGCTLSHIEALRLFLASGAPRGLILEDDVLGTDQDLADVLHRAREIPDPAIMICGCQDGMPARKYLFGKPTHQPGVFRLAGYSYHYIFRTSAYVLTRGAANQLLEAHQNCLQLADAWWRLTHGSDTRLYYTPTLHHPTEEDTSHIAKERAQLIAGQEGGTTPFIGIQHRYRRLRRRLGAICCRLSGYRKLIR